MDILASQTPLQFPAHARIAASRSSSPHHGASPRETAATPSGLPDSAFWTAYDHYMIEREAKAYRRAYVYSTLATFVRRLRQSIFKVRPRQV